MNTFATKCVTTLSKRKLGYFGHTLRKEHIRTGDLSKSVCNYVKIQNRVEFPTSTENSNTYCVAAHRHKRLLHIVTLHVSCMVQVQAKLCWVNHKIHTRLKHALQLFKALFTPV